MPSSAALFALTALLTYIRDLVRDRPSRATIYLLENFFGAVGEDKVVARIMVWTRDCIFTGWFYQMCEWSVLQGEELS